MPHLIIIIDEEITRLEGETEDAGLQDKLGTLRTKAHAVDQIIQGSSGEEEERHDALKDTEKWLKKASVSDNDFEAKLDEFIALLDQYD